MDKLLTPEPGLMLWTLITFGLLLVLLRVFAWKPLLAVIEERGDARFLHEPPHERRRLGHARGRAAGRTHGGREVVVDDLHGKSLCLVGLTGPE